MALLVRPCCKQHDAFRSISKNLPEYHLFLAPGWRNDSAICSEIEWRRAAAHHAGLTNEIERLRHEWTSDSGLEPASERVVFSPESEDDVFLDAFRRVAVGSLDRETRHGVERFGLDKHARRKCCRTLRVAGNGGGWRTTSSWSGSPFRRPMKTIR